MPYLECRNLRRVFHHFTLDISLSVEKGELMCILGPSGSGKSTLLGAISGTDSSVSGQILLDGEDITGMPIRKRRIGMVFQDFSLFPSMNVEKNIRYGMRDVPESEKHAETERLLEMVDLAGYGSRSVHELSGGEAQRIALIRAVAAKPRMLLLDEPLSALDAPLRKKLRTIIRQIHDRTGITMLYVTHDREEAFAIADRIMIMRGGRLEDIGTPEELYRHPSNLFTAFFTGEGSAVPMSCVDGKASEKVLFFRPEDAEINREGSSENHFILEKACIESHEYTGSGYLVRLAYKDRSVLAMSKEKPAPSGAGSSVSVYIPRDRTVILDQDQGFSVG